MTLDISCYYHPRQTVKAVPRVTLRPEDSPGGRVRCLSITWLWRTLQIRWWR